MFISNIYNISVWTIKSINIIKFNRAFVSFSRGINERRAFRFEKKQKKIKTKSVFSFYILNNSK